MDAEFDRIKSLGAMPPPHTRRFRFVPAADRSVFGTIEHGVVFVMAWWSGPASQAFSKLKQVLAKVDLAGRLELVVVDTDQCPDLYECPEFFEQLHGAGEIAWIRDGRVVCTSGIGYRPELIELVTRKFVRCVESDELFDLTAHVCGQLERWPTRDEMVRILAAAGLRVSEGRYSIRVSDCSHFQFCGYGGDVGDPSIDADADTPAEMIRDARIVSSALAKAGVRHRFGIYDDDGNQFGYVHHRWPDDGKRFEHAT